MVHAQRLASVRSDLSYHLLYADKGGGFSDCEMKHRSAGMENAPAHVFLNGHRRPIALQQSVRRL